MADPGVMNKQRRTSLVWEYFTRQEGGKISCNLCKKDLADGGETTNTSVQSTWMKPRNVCVCGGGGGGGGADSDGKRQTLMSTFTNARKSLLLMLLG